MKADRAVKGDTKYAKPLRYLQIRAHKPRRRYECVNSYHHECSEEYNPAGTIVPKSCRRVGVAPSAPKQFERFAREENAVEGDAAAEPG